MDIVFGGDGFIGKHLVTGLLKRDHIVQVADFPDIDIRKLLTIHSPIDTIYHLAGLSNIVPSIENPRDYYETNVTGTFNILEAARLGGVKKIVYAASSGCYGQNPVSPISEDHACDPHQPYALTKYLGEQLVLHYGKVYGMDVVSLRIFNAYGNGCLTKTTCPSLLNILLAQRANNKPLTIVGDGTQERDWVYVDDVVEAFILAAERGSGVYNLGTSVPTNVNRIADVIGGERKYIPPRGGEPFTIYADNSRLKALGWSPRVSIEQGLKEMMDNLDYWKDAKVFTAEGMQEETKHWSKKLKQ